MPSRRRDDDDDERLSHSVSHRFILWLVYEQRKILARNFSKRNKKWFGLILRFLGKVLKIIWVGLYQRKLWSKSVAQVLRVCKMKSYKKKS